MTKALVLYSGGLDSRLVVRILQEQGIEIETIYFNLPFGCGCCDLSCNFKFTQLENVKMTIMDTTKEPLLSPYLKTIKEAKLGRGSSYNPCRDCKIFMFNIAKEYAKKNNIEIIATGEVLGQRPMSQIKKSMDLIDNNLDFELLRPLSAKNLKETSYEKKGLVNREKLYAITGRNRKEQMELAKKFNISYPSPGGGCLLCEKALKKRFEDLLENNLITEKTLSLIPIGRHFIINNTWYIVARNSKECEILDNFKETLVGEAGKPSIYIQKISSSSSKDNSTDSIVNCSPTIIKDSKNDKKSSASHSKELSEYSTNNQNNLKSNNQTALNLQETFSTGASLKERNNLEKFKL